MTARRRGSGFLAVAGLMAAALSACSDPVTGSGALAEEALVPAPATSRPAGSASPASTVSPAPPPSATPSPSTAPTPSPSKRRDPGAVARAVDIRAGDLPGWRPLPGSRTGKDSLDWVIACVRDAGVSPGSLSGAQTPDFSPDGTARTSQVGTATGLFADEAAARRYLAALRQPAVAACVGAEAERAWPDHIRTRPAFREVYPKPRGAAEAAGIAGSAQVTSVGKVTYQFVAVRTGPVVTMVNTAWIGSSVAATIDRVVAKVAARQRTV